MAYRYPFLRGYLSSGSTYWKIQSEPQIKETLGKRIAKIEMTENEKSKRFFPSRGPKGIITHIFVERVVYLEEMRPDTDGSEVMNVIFRVKLSYYSLCLLGEFRIELMNIIDLPGEAFNADLHTVLTDMKSRLPSKTSSA